MCLCSPSLVLHGDFPHTENSETLSNCQTYQRGTVNYIPSRELYTCLDGLQNRSLLVARRVTHDAKCSRTLLGAGRRTSLHTSRFHMHTSERLKLPIVGARSNAYLREMQVVPSGRVKLALRPRGVLHGVRLNAEHRTAGQTSTNPADR